MDFILLLLVEIVYLAIGLYAMNLFDEPANIKIMLGWPILFIWCVGIAVMDRLHSYKDDTTYNEEIYGIVPVQKLL